MGSVAIVLFEILPLFSFFTAMALFVVAKITNLKPFYYVSVGYLGEYTFLSFVFRFVRMGLYNEWFDQYDLYESMQILLVGAMLIMAIILFSKVSYAKEKPIGEVIEYKTFSNE